MPTVSEGMTIRPATQRRAADDAGGATAHEQAHAQRHRQRQQQPLGAAHTKELHSRRSSDPNRTAAYREAIALCRHVGWAAHSVPIASAFDPLRSAAAAACDAGAGAVQGGPTPLPRGRLMIDVSENRGGREDGKPPPHFDGGGDDGEAPIEEVATSCRRSSQPPIACATPAAAMGACGATCGDGAHSVVGDNPIDADAGSQGEKETSVVSEGRSSTDDRSDEDVSDCASANTERTNEATDEYGMPSTATATPMVVDPTEEAHAERRREGRNLCDESHDCREVSPLIGGDEQNVAIVTLMWSTAAAAAAGAGSGGDEGSVVMMPMSFANGWAGVTMRMVNELLMHELGTPSAEYFQILLQGTNVVIDHLSNGGYTLALDAGMGPGIDVYVVPSVVSAAAAATAALGAASMLMMPPCWDWTAATAAAATAAAMAAHMNMHQHLQLRHHQHQHQHQPWLLHNPVPFPTIHGPPPSALPFPPSCADGVLSTGPSLGVALAAAGVPEWNSTPPLGAGAHATPPTSPPPPQPSTAAATASLMTTLRRFHNGVVARLSPSCPEGARNTIGAGADAGAREHPADDASPASARGRTPEITPMRARQRSANCALDSDLCERALEVLPRMAPLQLPLAIDPQYAAAFIATSEGRKLTPAQRRAALERSAAIQFIPCDCSLRGIVAFFNMFGTLTRIRVIARPSPSHVGTAAVTGFVNVFCEFAETAAADRCIQFCAAAGRRLSTALFMRGAVPESPIKSGISADAVIERCYGDDDARGEFVLHTPARAFVTYNDGRVANPNRRVWLPTALAFWSVVGRVCLTTRLPRSAWNNVQFLHSTATFDEVLEQARQFWCLVSQRVPRKGNMEVLFARLAANAPTIPDHRARGYGAGDYLLRHDDPDCSTDADQEAPHGAIAHERHTFTRPPQKQQKQQQQQQPLDHLAFDRLQKLEDATHAGAIKFVETGVQSVFYQTLRDVCSALHKVAQLTASGAPGRSHNSSVATTAGHDDSLATVETEAALVPLDHSRLQALIAGLTFSIRCVALHLIHGGDGGVTDAAAHLDDLVGDLETMLARGQLAALLCPTDADGRCTAELFRSFCSALLVAAALVEAQCVDAACACARIVAMVCARRQLRGGRGTARRFFAPSSDQCCLDDPSLAAAAAVGGGGDGMVGDYGAPADRIVERCARFAGHAIGGVFPWLVRGGPSGGHAFEAAQRTSAAHAKSASETLRLRAAVIPGVTDLPVFLIRYPKFFSQLLL